jgi:hypothetical protein
MVAKTVSNPWLAPASTLGKPRTKLEMPICRAEGQSNLQVLATYSTLPASLTRYMASSAERSSDSASVPPSG